METIKEVCVWFMSMIGPGLYGASKECTVSKKLAHVFTYGKSSKLVFEVSGTVRLFKNWRAPTQSRREGLASDVKTGS